MAHFFKNMKSVVVIGVCRKSLLLGTDTSGSIREEKRRRYSQRRCFFLDGRRQVHIVYVRVVCVCLCVCFGTNANEKRTRTSTTSLLLFRLWVEVIFFSFLQAFVKREETTSRSSSRDADTIWHSRIGLPLTFFWPTQKKEEEEESDGGHSRDTSQ